MMGMRPSTFANKVPVLGYGLINQSSLLLGCELGWISVLGVQTNTTMSSTKNMILASLNSMIQWQLGGLTILPVWDCRGTNQHTFQPMQHLDREESW